MEMQVIAVIALLLIAYGAVSARLERTAITGPMVFTAVGLLIGPAVLDLVELDIGAEGLRLLAEVTLALVLFVDAVRIDPRRLRRQAALPTRMLSIGFPLAVVTGALLGVWLLDLPWTVAALVAATLAPTDAALGQAVVSEEAVPVRIRQTLNVESGLNDGLAVPFVTIGLALVAADLGVQLELERSGLGWVAFVTEQVGFGLLVGLAIGAGGAVVIDRATRRGWMDGVSRQVGPLALALLAWAGAELIGGNGFIAAFVGGLTFGAVAPAGCHDVTDFSEDEGHLLALLVFLVFGAGMLGPTLTDGVSLSTVVYAVLSLTVVRMLPVAISLVGAHLRPETVAFLGWFGPRGLASVVFALLVADELSGDIGDRVEQIVTVTVALSVLVHGLSARPLALRYAAWAEGHARTHDDMPEQEHVDERHLGRAHR